MKNLFETYDVNGRQYTDNLPKNALISIPKKQYIEYEQQREEIKKIKKVIKEARDYINKGAYNCDGSYILQILDKVGSDKE